MAFRVPVRGVIVEVDTPQEVLALVTEIDRGHPARQQADRLVPPVAAPVVPPAADATADHFAVTVREILSHVRPASKQDHLLAALAAAPDGLTDAELRERFGYRDNMVLSGVLSGIVKWAKKAGAKTTEIVERGHLFANPDAYGYRLSARFLREYAAAKAAEAKPSP